MLLNFGFIINNNSNVKIANFYLIMSHFVVECWIWRLVGYIALISDETRFQLIFSISKFLLLVINPHTCFTVAFCFLFIIRCDESCITALRHYSGCGLGPILCRLNRVGLLNEILV